MANPSLCSLKAHWLKQGMDFLGGSGICVKGTSYQGNLDLDPHAAHYGLL